MAAVDDLRSAIEGNLAHVLTADGIAAWWSLPLPRFADQTAEAVLADGRGNELLAATARYLDPSFG